jgi:DNA polymerase III sliding clamp (beta) subunit (PCNA family)
MYREYPEYSRVFELADKSLVLDKNTLLNGVSSIEDVWDSDDHNRLTIELKDNELTLTTDKARFEYGEFEGLPDFVIDVDGKDFLNILRTIADDEVRLKCGDERQGMTVESVGWDDHRAYLVSLVRR